MKAEIPSWHLPSDVHTFMENVRYSALRGAPASLRTPETDAGPAPGQQRRALERRSDDESRDLDSDTISVAQESHFINLDIRFLISIKLNCWTRL